MEYSNDENQTEMNAILTTSVYVQLIIRTSLKQIVSFCSCEHVNNNNNTWQ